MTVSGIPGGVGIAAPGGLRPLPLADLKEIRAAVKNHALLDLRPPEKGGLPHNYTSLQVDCLAEALIERNYLPGAVRNGVGHFPVNETLGSELEAWTREQQAVRDPDFRIGRIAERQVWSGLKDVQGHVIPGNNDLGLPPEVGVPPPGARVRRA